MNEHSQKLIEEAREFVRAARQMGQRLEESAATIDAARKHILFLESENFQMRQKLRDGQSGDQK